MVPFVNNYSKETYKSANQNWGVDVDSNNFLYVANNDALLTFDGFRWERYELPNKTILRSVKTVNDTIYVGTYEDFGFFIHNKKGDLEYHSLSKTLRESDLQNLEFWQIDQLGKVMYFRSFSKIFRWNGKQVEEVKLPNNLFISSFVWKDKYLMGTVGNGIYSIEIGTHQVSQMVKPEFFENGVISAISEIKGQLVVGTDKGRLYILSENGFRLFNSEINQELEKYQLNKLTATKSGHLVVGTVLNGVYVLDVMGHILYNLNKTNGLQNNTVLSQVMDNNGNLWLGLDNGIDVVELNSPIRFYTDQTGLLGSVYALFSDKDRILLGSNKGVFSLRNDILTLIEGSQGHVWDIFKIDNHLLASHNNKLYEIQNDKLLDKKSLGGWYPTKIPEKNDYVRGLYNGLGKIQNKNNDIKEHRIEGFSYPTKYTAFEATNILWATHPYKGVFKLTLNQTHDTVLEVKNYSNRGLISEYKASVFSLNNRVIFPSKYGWQIYNPITDSIEMYQALNDVLGNMKESVIVYQDMHGMWLNKGNRLVYYNSSDKSLTQLPSRFFSHRLIQSNVEIIKKGQKKWLISLDDGFAEIDSSLTGTLPKTKVISPAKISVRKIKSGNQSLNLDSLPITIPAGKNNLQLEIALVGRPLERLIEYRLTNYDLEWKTAQQGVISYNNIPYGNYLLEIRNLNHYTSLNSSTLEVPVKVLPPWYLSKTAVYIYLILFLILIYLLVILNKFLVVKNQNKLRREHISEQRKIIHERRLDLEKKLAQIKAEEIKKELIMKEKELANTAMSILKNKEILKEIKKEIEDRKEQFIDPYSYKRLVSKLEKNIRDEESHEVFETNFNAVHEDFQKLLIDKHPKLTHKDLRLCALLKMNLSNKEIAPILNITPRSVELQRYRLRKKLNLEREVDLVKYLIHF